MITDVKFDIITLDGTLDALDDTDDQSMDSYNTRCFSFYKDDNNDGKIYCTAHDDYCYDNYIDNDYDNNNDDDDDSGFTRLFF